MTAYPLSMSSREVRKVESLSSSILANPAAISDKLKREAVDQCRFTFSYMHNNFSKLIAAIFI